MTESPRTWNFNMLKSVHQCLWVLRCSFTNRASKSMVSGCLRRVQKSFRCPFSAASFRLLPASQPANFEVATVGQALPANAMLTMLCLATRLCFSNGCIAGDLEQNAKAIAISMGVSSPCPFRAPPLLHKKFPPQEQCPNWSCNSVCHGLSYAWFKAICLHLTKNHVQVLIVCMQPEAHGQNMYHLEVSNIYGTKHVMHTYDSHKWHQVT